MHALRDMTNAAKLLLAHTEAGSELGWARHLVVHELTSTDPPLAAALLFQEVEMELSTATNDVYCASANRLAEARDVLRCEAHAHLWKEYIAAFRERHADTRG